MTNVFNIYVLANRLTQSHY